MTRIFNVFIRIRLFPIFLRFLYRDFSRLKHSMRLKIIFILCFCKDLGDGLAFLTLRSFISKPQRAKSNNGLSRKIDTLACPRQPCFMTHVCRRWAVYREYARRHFATPRVLKSMHVRLQYMWKHTGFHSGFVLWRSRASTRSPDKPDLFQNGRKPAWNKAEFTLAGKACSVSLSLK